MHKAWKWGLVCMMLIIAMFCSRYLFNFNDLFCYFITHFLGDYRCSRQLLWGRISDSCAEDQAFYAIIRYVYTSWSLCDVLFIHCTRTEWIAPSEWLVSDYSVCKLWIFVLCHRDLKFFCHSKVITCIRWSMCIFTFTGYELPHIVYVIMVL